MSELFVDASGWVAVVNKSDALHAMAKSIYNQRFATGQVIITTTAVMMEVGNVLSLVRMRHLAVNLRHRLESSPRVHIIEVDNQKHFKLIQEPAGCKRLQPLECFRSIML